jgi:hypothetical protein
MGRIWRCLEKQSRNNLGCYEQRLMGDYDESSEYQNAIQVTLLKTKTTLSSFFPCPRTLWGAEFEGDTQH